MVRNIFKIPTRLNRTFLDHEISFQVFGMQVPPTPIKQLLFLVGGALLIAWSATSTSLKSAHPGLIAFYLVWALATLIYFGTLTKTRELRARTLPALASYAPKAARVVITRRDSDPNPFASIVGIDAIDTDGRITFADGTFGQIYLVAGTASFLLFEEDSQAILKRVDAFWRKVETSCEYIFITTKEPQRIYHQVANLERRNRALEVRDPDLLELQNEQYAVLTGHVGDRFTSIHQYVVLKATSAEALRQAHQILQAEVEDSTHMIKEITMLDRDEATQMLRVLYQGVSPKIAAA